MYSKIKHTLVLCTSFFVAAGAVAAESGQRGVIEELIVTATHRETKLMETPQAISAISAAQIEALGPQGYAR